MNFFVYGLIDPRTLEIRYIGSSRTGIIRPGEHRYPSNLKRKNTHTTSWIKSMLVDGVTYNIISLEETGKDVDRLYDAEQWWIAYGRCLGWRLTNHTNGGEGQRGWVPSEETKAKISASLKGKPLSLETRAKLSAVRKGRIVSQETRDKIRAGHLGKKHTDETRRKMSEKANAHYAEHGGRVQTQEEIEKRRKSLFGNKRGCALKGRVFSEESLAKMSIAQRQRRAREKGLI